MAEGDSIQQLLMEKFRLQSFRRGQREVIDSVVAGKDVIAVMPTGAGKSLCYQLPALFRPGLTIVVSPLIALMQDQANSLRALGIPSGCLHSDQEGEEKRQIFQELRTSSSYLLYLSPERVQKPGFADWIAKNPIALFAIDEAHCISQWGADFREDYHRLNLLRELRSDVPILALTATATLEVVHDIGRRLNLRKPDKHVYGFYRPNLYYQVEICDDEDEKLRAVDAALEQAPPGRILIYCGTRKQTEMLFSLLSERYQGVGFYHAGMTGEERTRTQSSYQSGELRILCATNAFGMGVNYPDIRLVLHFQMPANVENLYQEMGRAGRDGLDSTCVLLYAKRDKGLHSYFITQSGLEGQEAKRRWRALDTIVQFAEGGECRHSGILTYFKDTQRIPVCGHCDVCAPQSPRKVTVARVTEEFEPVVKEASKRRSSKNSKPKKSVSDAPLTLEEERRYEVLREWRREYAEANDIPPFIVFSNKTLRDICQKDPKNASDLEHVYGMGSQKIEHIGPPLLKALEDCRGA